MKTSIMINSSSILVTPKFEVGQEVFFIRGNQLTRDTIESRVIYDMGAGDFDESDYQLEKSSSISGIVKATSKRTIAVKYYFFGGMQDAEPVLESDIYATLEEAAKGIIAAYNEREASSNKRLHY